MDDSSVKVPWKTLSKQLKYENPWIKVEEHQVINPSNKPGIYGVVNFKNRAVAIVPLFANGDILLVGQYRYPLQQYHWELPMGGSPKNEPCLVCAKRELKEETGYSAKNWEPFLEMHLSNSITQEQGFAFIATELMHGKAELEETEDIQLKRLPFDEAFERVMAGEITDSITVAAILKVRLLGRA